MTLRGTDPESCIAEYTLVYEDKTNPIRVQGAECRVQGVGCRMWGVGCRVQGAGCRVLFVDDAGLGFEVVVQLPKEIGVLLPNNQRQFAPKDVLPSRICANYCAPCQPLLRVFPGWIQSSCRNTSD